MEKKPTIADFMERGYRQYSDPVKKSTSFVQRDVRDGGVKYFINVYYFEIGEHKMFQANVQFTKAGVVFNIDLLDVESVDQVEAFFEDVWNKLKCDRYDGQTRTDI